MKVKSNQDNEESLKKQMIKYCFILFLTKLWMNKQILLIILCLFSVSFAKAIFPPYVWIYWNNASTMPQFYRRCLENNNRLLKDTRWQVKFITDSNVSLFLTNEEFPLEKYKKVLPSSQMTSDLIRLELLNKHGGVYLDLSGFLTENLNWLDHLDQNPEEMFQVKEDIQCMIFSTTQPQYAIPTSKYINIIKRNYETGFIASIPQSKFINDWLNTFRQSIQDIIENKKPFSNYFLIYSDRLKFIEKKVQEIEAGLHPQYKTYYQYYKIASIITSKCMYFNHVYRAFPGQLVEELITKYMVNELKQDFNFTCRYYLKQNHFDNQYVVAYFDGNVKKQQELNENLYPLYYSLLVYFPWFQQYSCLGSAYIVNNSLIYNFLMKDFNNTNFKIYQKDELPLLCQYNTNLQKLLIKIMIFSIPFMVGLMYIFGKYLKIAFQRLKLTASQRKKQTFQKLNLDEKPQVKEQSLQQIFSVETNSSQNKISWNLFQTILLLITLTADLTFNFLLAVKFQYLAQLTMKNLMSILIITALYFYLKKLTVSVNCQTVIFTNVIVIVALWIDYALLKSALMVIGSGNNVYQNFVMDLLVGEAFILRYFLMGLTVYKILFSLVLLLKNRKISTLQIKEKNSNT